MHTTHHYMRRTLLQGLTLLLLYRLTLLLLYRTHLLLLYSIHHYLCLLVNTITKPKQSQNLNSTPYTLHPTPYTQSPRSSVQCCHTDLGYTEGWCSRG